MYICPIRIINIFEDNPKISHKPVSIVETDETTEVYVITETPVAVYEKFYSYNWINISRNKQIYNGTYIDYL